MKELPLYRVIFNPDDETQGISAMSIVNDPAVGSHFFRFNETDKDGSNKIHFKFYTDEERMIIRGVALRANYPIYRRLPDGRELMVTFSPEEIEKVVCEYMRSGILKEININHGQNLNGLLLIESFIKTPDMVLQNFNDVDDGSWFIGYKVEDSSLWDSIKRGELNGFSAEIEVGIELVEEPDTQKEFCMKLYNLIKDL